MSLSLPCPVSEEHLNENEYVTLHDALKNETKTYFKKGSAYFVGTGGDPNALKDIKDLFTSLEEDYAKVPLMKESPFKAHKVPNVPYELSEEENKRFDELSNSEEEASIAKKVYAKLIGEVSPDSLLKEFIETKTYKSGIRIRSSGLWSPEGPVIENVANSLVNDIVAKPFEPIVMGIDLIKIVQERKNDGLLTYLEDAKVVAFEPNKIYKRDYVLSEEENERFDNLPGTKEEIKVAKEIYAKLIGQQPVSLIDSLVEQMEQLWHDNLQKEHERTVLFAMNEAQMKMFEEAVKKEFGKI